MLVDLLGFSVLSQQAAQHSLSSHPEDLVWHTSIAGTFSLTEASVASLSLGGHVASVARLGVHGIWSLDDEAILDELANTLTGVSKSNVGGFVRIHPDLSLAALKHGSGQSTQLRGYGKGDISMEE